MPHSPGCKCGRPFQTISRTRNGHFPAGASKRQVQDVTDRKISGIQLKSRKYRNNSSTFFHFVPDCFSYRKVFRSCHTTFNTTNFVVYNLCDENLHLQYFTIEPCEFARKPDSFSSFCHADQSETNECNFRFHTNESRGMPTNISKIKSGAHSLCLQLMLPCTWGNRKYTYGNYIFQFQRLKNTRIAI